MSTYEDMFIDAAQHDYAPSTRTPFDFRERSFIENVVTSAKLQPFWQALDEANGFHEKYQGTDWKPLMSENLKGYEDYSWRLREARNPEHEVMMKEQIDRNQKLRREEAENGTWQSMIFSEVANPLNYIPIPGVAGMGFVRGAAATVALNVPLVGLEEAMRIAYDPTTTGDEAAPNVFFTSVFSAGIGGLAGKFLKTPSVPKWLETKGKEEQKINEVADQVYENTPEGNQLSTFMGRSIIPDTSSEGLTKAQTDSGLGERWTERHEAFFLGGYVGTRDHLGNKLYYFDDPETFLNTPFVKREQLFEWLDTNQELKSVFDLYVHLSDIIPVRTTGKIKRGKDGRRIGNEGTALRFENLGPNTGGDASARKFLIRVSLNKHVKIADTLNHEIIHGLRQMGLFTDNEWDLLRAKSRAEWMGKHDVNNRWKAGYEKLKLDETTGPGSLDKALEEEGIAEAFREWMQNPPDMSNANIDNVIDPKTLSIFKRWKKKLDDLIKKLRKKTDEQIGLGKAPANADEIFERIRRGDFKRRAELYGTFNMHDEFAFSPISLADNPNIVSKPPGQTIQQSVAAQAAAQAAIPKVDPGAKKVWGGFHNVVQISTMGTLVQSGSRAIADLAMKMAGDFGFMLERNIGGAEATPQSAFLRAGIWDGQAIDTVRQADGAWVRYLSDGATEGTKFGSINVAAAAQKVKDKISRAPSDKMSHSEFMTEVSKSFTKDGIVSDNPYVKEAADAIDAFMKKAGDEGYANGLIPSTAGWVKTVTKNKARLANIQAITGQLNKDPKNPLNRLKQKYLDRQYRRLMGENAGIKLKGLDSYEGMEDTINDILAWGDRKSDRAASAVDTIESQLAQNSYVDMKALQNLTQRVGPLAQKEQKYFDWLSKRYEEYLPLLDDPDLNLDEIFTAFADEIIDGSGTPKQKAFLKKLRKDAEAPLSDKQKQYITDMQDSLVQFHEPGLIDRPNAYLPIVYDMAAIAKDFALGPKSKFRLKVIEKFSEGYRLQGRVPPAAKVRIAADKWISETILKQTEDADGVGLSHRATMNGTFRWMRSRSIGFTHDEIADFVETDATRIMRDYTRAFGISNEFTKMFGNRTADDAIDEAMIAAVDEFDGNLSFKELETQLNKHDTNLRRLADMTNGDRNRRHPLTWDKYAADSLRSWAAATMLGRVIKTVVPEVAHIAMVNGLKKTMGFAFQALARDMDQYRHIIKDLKPHTIEGWDMMNAEAAQRLIGHLEGHGPAKSDSLNKLAQSKTSQGWFNFAGGNLYNLNLLAPATEAMKTFQMVMSSHRFIDDIMSGVDPDRLASHGFTPDAIVKIRSMVEDGTIAKSNEEGLWHANVSEWVDGDLRAAYMSAVSGEIRRVVATAGPGDMRDAFAGYWGKPGSQTRFALGALPFQFMQFSIASTTKYTLSAAQGRDASPVIGLAMLVGMGYLSTWMKTPDWAWDKMTYDERLLRAVEGSGALALFGDAPAMLEQATANQYGIRPMLGLDPKFPVDNKMDQASLLWGPGGDKIADLYKMIIDPDTTNRDRARYLRRSVPGNDLVYWHHLFLDADPYTEQAFDQLY